MTTSHDTQFEPAASNLHPDRRIHTIRDDLGNKSDGRVVGQHGELLPCGVSGVRFGGQDIEGELRLQLALHLSAVADVSQDLDIAQRRG